VDDGIPRNVHLRRSDSARALRRTVKYAYGRRASHSIHIWSISSMPPSIRAGLHQPTLADAIRQVQKNACIIPGLRSADSSRRSNEAMLQCIMMKPFSLLPKRRSFIVLLILTLALSWSCSKSVLKEEEARKVLNDFYTNQAPEPLLCDPLINAGKAIVPYLVREIENKNMPRRRYAIGALERLGDRRSLPLLVKVLDDESEVFYFRDDAIRAIFHIDQKLAEELMPKYSGRIEGFERTVQLLKQGKI